MIVKPNPEKKTDDGTQLRVFDPVKRKFLPEGGAHVPENAYWMRRLAAGEVVKVDTLERSESSNKNVQKVAKADKTPQKVTKKRR